MVVAILAPNIHPPCQETMAKHSIVHVRITNFVRLMCGSLLYSGNCIHTIIIVQKQYTTYKKTHKHHKCINVRMISIDEMSILDPCSRPPGHQGPYLRTSPVTRQDASPISCHGRRRAKLLGAPSTERQLEESSLGRKKNNTTKSNH